MSKDKDYPEMEGDVVYVPQQYPSPQDWEEMDTHFTLAKFEDLLNKHGLAYLLKRMTTAGGERLMKDAYILIKEEFERTFKAEDAG